MDVWGGGRIFDQHKKSQKFCQKNPGCLCKPWGNSPIRTTKTAEWQLVRCCRECTLDMKHQDALLLNHLCPILQYTDTSSSLSCSGCPDKPHPSAKHRYSILLTIFHLLVLCFVPSSFHPDWSLSFYKTVKVIPPIVSKKSKASLSPSNK